MEQVDYRRLEAEAPAMRPPRVRFTVRTLMMVVLATAASAALFAKVRQHVRDVVQTPVVLPDQTWVDDAPALFLLATALTALALAAWKGHSVSLTMLQVTLTCLGWLALIWVVEAGYRRAARYWFEAAFAAAVTLPLVVRRAVKASLPRGPRRDWWRNACEAVFFSFLNMLLVAAGVFLQAAIYIVLTVR
jgi:hypothetical protein